MSKLFGEITDKLVEALVNVRVAKAHDPFIDDFPTQRAENARIRREHLEEARKAVQDVNALINDLEAE